MGPLEATLVSIGGVLVSIITALATFGKAMADRRAGINNHHLEGTRLGLEAMQASIVVKDSLILQLKDSLEDLRKENDTLRKRLDDLQIEVDLLREASGHSATP